MLNYVVILVMQCHTNADPSGAGSAVLRAQNFLHRLSARGGWCRGASCITVFWSYLYGSIGPQYESEKRVPYILYAHE